MCNEKKNKGDEDMAKIIENKCTYKKLDLGSVKVNEISVTPKVKDGKLMFDRKNKSHRYIVEDD